MSPDAKVGSMLYANEMNDFIGGKHHGGIRYSGRFPNIERIGVIIGGGTNAIYPDELHRGSINYIGEGQEDDQRLTFGNRTLAWAHLHDLPVHVFINRGKNRYQYQGPHHVVAVSVTVAPDRDDEPRGAFRFELEGGT